eukprot:255393_1
MARIQSTNDARTEGENASESKQESDSASKKVDDSGPKRPKCIVDVGWLTKTVEQVERVCRKVSDGEIAKLKKSADAAFKSGRTSDAIDLYSEVIQMCPGLIAARSNRAACYLHEKLFLSCLEDCCHSLALLSGSKESSPLKQRILARRGGALFQLCAYESARADYESALSIGDSDALRADLVKIKKIMEEKKTAASSKTKSTDQPITPSVRPSTQAKVPGIPSARLVEPPAPKFIPVRARSAYTRACMLYNIADFRRAGRVFLRALQDSGDQTSLARALILSNLSAACLGAGEYLKCVEYATRSTKIITQNGTDKDKHTRTLCVTLSWARVAVANLWLGQTNDALEAQQKAIRTLGTSEPGLLLLLQRDLES